MAGVMMFEFIHDYIVHERKNALEAFLNSREGNTKKATLLKTQYDRREAVRLAQEVKNSRDAAQEILEGVINRPRGFDQIPKNYEQFKKLMKEVGA